MFNAKRHWTETEDTTIRAMRAEAAPWDVIAARIGVNRATITRRAELLGVSTEPLGGVGPKRQQPATQDDPHREPLPAGHPASWGAIIAGSCLEGARYQIDG